MRKPSSPRHEAPGVKELEWEGNSKALLLEFPADVRHEAGFQLDKVQHGLPADDEEFIPAIGPGARELRVDDRDGWYRVFFVARFGDKVHVLHAIKKKTNKTPKAAIDLAGERYRAVVARYRKHRRSDEVYDEG